MSSLVCEIVAIDDVLKHPNADRLDLVKVKDWLCVAGRNNPNEPKYKPGDKALYIPIDSVLPAHLEEYLFPVDGKMHLKKSRIKTEKIRGAISQGLVVDLTPEFDTVCGFDISAKKVGYDATSALGITKYEPPVEDMPQHMRTSSSTKVVNNPLFFKYTDIENLKNFGQRFEPGEAVSITEKLHGTSARYAKLPTSCRTWWKKVLRFFGFLPKEEFCYGSRNMQLQDRLRKKNFYPGDVYAKIAKQYGLANILQKGETLYGEIVGSGIQANYTYGCKQDEHKFFAYDVQKDGRYLSPGEFKIWCAQRNIPTVPLLYEGPFERAVVDQLRKGDSTIGGQKVREGVVVKPQTETTDHFGRKILKHISDEYLLKDQTDFH